MIGVLKSHTEPWAKEILDRSISIVMFVLEQKSKEIDDQVNIYSALHLQQPKSEQSGEKD